MIWVSDVTRARVTSSREWRHARRHVHTDQNGLGVPSKPNFEFLISGDMANFVKACLSSSMCWVKWEIFLGGHKLLGGNSSRKPTGSQDLKKIITPTFYPYLLIPLSFWNTVCKKNPCQDLSSVECKVSCLILLLMWHFFVTALCSYSAIFFSK